MQILESSQPLINPLFLCCRIILEHYQYGNQVAVGAICVVTRDIKDNAVVVGIPGKVISFQGSDGHINHIDFWFRQG